MQFNQSAQLKFGLYFVILFILLFALALAQDSNPQADFNSGPLQAPDTNNNPDQNAFSGQNNGTDENANETPDLNAGQTPDQNTFDTNATTTSPPEETQSLKITIISPLFGETLSNTGIVIVSIQPAELIIRAWFDISGQKEFELPQSGANFSADFNSLEFPDGNYSFSVHACTDNNCTAMAIPIEIKNIAPKIPPEIGKNPDQNIVVPQPQSVSVKGSNEFSALTVFDAEMQIVASGTEALQVLSGVYRAKIDFFESVISTVSLEQASLDSNATILAVNEFVAENFAQVPDANVEWLKSVAVKPNVSFGFGKITFLVPGSANELFKCENWLFEENRCETTGRTVLELQTAQIELEMAGSSQAYAFAKVAKNAVFVPDINVQELDSNALKTKQKKIGKRTLKLQKKFANFSANDLPLVEIDVFDENGFFVDENVEAFLEFPDGTRKQIGAGKIKKNSAGKTVVEAFWPRSFKPGTYKIVTRVPSEEGIVEESQSFEWGLIAVNLRKSIYRPNETAEFEIVVLDRESFGVRGAAVTLAVVFPNQSTQYLSTENALVLETTSSGIYVSKMQVLEEGTYSVFARAIAPNIDSSIQTTFEVRQNFAFDIERLTQTKIDPAVQPISVQLKITSLAGSKKADITEFVPAEFEISQKTEDVLAGTDFEVSLDEEKKTIRLKNVDFDSDGKAVIEYYYRVPDRKPWLYNIGPLEILSEQNEKFFEARSWMVAVDANPTSKLFFRRNADGNTPIEPMPNDANCGTGCGITSYLTNTQDINSSNDLAGASAVTRAVATGQTTGIMKMNSFVSPKLTAQTITASGTWKAGISCVLSGGGNTSRNAFFVYRWIASTDSNGERIVPKFSSTVCDQTAAAQTAAAAGAYSSITFNRGDKLVTEVDINVTSNNDRTFTMSWNGASRPDDGNLTLPSGVTLRFAGDLNTGIVAPANNATQTINTSLDINVLGSCRNYHCGDTNVTLQYCITPSDGCDTFYDLNTESHSALYASTYAYKRDTSVASGDKNFFVITIIPTQLGTYTIRSKIDSNTSADINYSNLNKADVNITVSAPVNLSFSLLLPSTGCTQGKGSLDAGVTCDRGYFETTDTTGLADQNKVDAEGQTSAIPFFVYDNQSSTNTDLNFTLDLNAALPSTLALKASKTYTGWSGAGTCANIDVNCVNVTTSRQNIGRAVFSAGTQDLNIWVFGDFIGASGGQTDRNANSTSFTYYYPDVNVVYPENEETITILFLPQQKTDLNVTVQDSDTNAQAMLIDLNFSTQNKEGTGTVILNDANLSTNFRCDSNNLSSAQTCMYRWNASGATCGVSYYLLAKVFDQNSNTDFSVGNKTFEINDETC